MQPNESPTRKSADSKAARPGSVVLLVEEEDPLRALLRRIVESEGHEVLEARNAEEARAILASAGKSVRVVLADLAQPGISGPQGLRKHIPRGVKLLMLSRADTGKEPPGLADGVAFYLSNPFQPDALAAKLRDLFRQE